MVGDLEREFIILGDMTTEVYKVTVDNENNSLKEQRLTDLPLDNSIAVMNDCFLSK